jgi:hypothetical protein
MEHHSNIIWYETEYFCLEKTISKRFIKITIILLAFIFVAFGIWRYFVSIDISLFLSDLREVLSRANLFLFCVAICIYLFSVLMTAMSWNAVLKIYESSVSVLQLIPIWMAGIFVNNVTPMSRAGGEIARIYGLRRKFKLSYTVAVVSVFLSKLTEFAPVSLMVIIGFPVLAQYHILSWWQLGLIGLVTCFVIAIALWLIKKRHFLPFIWEKLYNYLLSQEEKAGVSQPVMKKPVWSKDHKKAFAESLIFSCVFWLLGLLRLKTLAYALDIDLSFSATAAVTVWYIIVGFLAFTPGGIGIVEGGLTAGLILLGIPASQALALTILDRSISYVLSSGIGAICLLSMGGKHLLSKVAGERG